MILAILTAAAVTAAGVKVELTVSPEGAVTHCAVVETSAPPEVADETCRVSSARAQRAARDASGMPVESKRLVTVRYQPANPGAAG